MNKIRITLFLCVILSLFLFGCATMEREWSKAKRTNTINDYREFISKYPDSPMISEAKGRIEELRIEAKIRLEKQRFYSAEQKNKLSTWAKFLREYPEGKFFMEAKAKMDSLAAKIQKERCSDPYFIKIYPKWLKSGKLDDAPKGKRFALFREEGFILGARYGFISDGPKMVLELRKGYIVHLEGKGVIRNVRQGVDVLVGYDCD